MNKPSFLGDHLYLVILWGLAVGYGFIRSGRSRLRARCIPVLYAIPLERNGTSSSIFRREHEHVMNIFKVCRAKVIFSCGTFGVRKSKRHGTVGKSGGNTFLHGPWKAPDLMKTAWLPLVGNMFISPALSYVLGLLIPHELPS